MSDQELDRLDDDLLKVFMKVAYIQSCTRAVHSEEQPARNSDSDTSPNLSAKDGTV